MSYGNSGYNQIDGYGANPYDQGGDGGNGGRYNNYSQGRYDDRTS
jgi:syntaxin 1B/2/3